VSEEDTVADRLSAMELLKKQASIIQELNDRGILRSYNNPVGDFAEYLCVRAFGWKLAGNSAKGFDASDAQNRYQIKARRLTRRNNSRQLSAIRALDLNGFDVLVGLLLAEDYTVYRAALIPYGRIKASEPRFSKHVNGHLFFLTDDVWTWPDVRDVTEELRRCAEAI
jgi:hypothetical protein